MPSFSPLSLRVRAELFTQLAQLESSGMPIDRVMALLDVSGEAVQRIAAMRSRIANGDGPAMAGERSGVFSKLEARLIHATWTAGNVGAMYRRLAVLYTTRSQQLATLKARMALPALVLGMALLLRPLPALIGGSGFGAYLLSLLTPLLFLAAAFYALRFLWRQMLATASTSDAPTALISLPVIGTLLIRRNVRDFLESLALMLEAGIPMLEALPLALETIEIGAIRQQFAQLGPAVAKGRTLSQALWAMSYLTDLDSGARAVEFAHTGETSGTLPEMLLRHVAMETESLDQTFKQIMDWAPRIAYGLIVLWVVYGMVLQQSRLLGAATGH